MQVLDPCDSLRYIDGVLPMPDFICTRDINDAEKFLETHGRVVLKAVAPGVIHKSDKGAVVLNITDNETLAREFHRLLGFGGSVLVQEQVSGVELFLGAKNDPQFGPVVLFGVGGIFVELYEDVSVRAAPVPREEALEMIDELKGKKILSGFRGRYVDKQALADLISKFSRFVYEKRPREMDINPLIAKGDSFWAVDVRVITD